MKRGCLFLLLVWLGSAAGVFYLAQGRQPALPWFVPILLGLGVALVIAQLTGIFYALRKWLAASRDPQTWKDGQFVALSGKLVTLGTPYVSPLSGRPMALVEYQVEKRTSSGDSSTTLTHFHGFHMTPCGLQGPRGTVRLHGFPLLNSFEKDYGEFEPDNAARFVEHLRATRPREPAKNPLEMLREFAAVLDDEDGDVAADFIYPRAPFSAATLNALPRRAASRGSVGSEAPDDEEDAGTGSSGDDADINLTEQILAEGYRFSEQFVTPGQEVAAFGTYRAKQRALDVGSGFTSVHHALRPGSVARAVRREFLQSIIGMIVFGAITIGGFGAAFPELRAFGLAQWRQVQERLNSRAPDGEEKAP